jgi:chemotaxis protein histidine kinase CheA
MAAEKSLTFNYAKYVFGKIEREFYNHSYPVDLAKTVRFINAIMNSQNLLRDIYIITKIKKLSPLGNYMLFMMKKAETGQINFENLIPNMEKDKEFILRVLTEFFMTKEPGSRKTWQDIHHEVKETIEEIEKQKEKEISVDSENKFKIEELDNELVTEEFIDKNIEEIEAKQKYREEEESVYKTGSYLELIKNIEEEEKKAFNLPGEEQEEEQQEEQQEEEITEKTDITVEQIKKDENAAFGFDDLETEIPQKEVIPESTDKAEKEEIIIQEEKQEAPEEVAEEIIEEISASDEKPELEETISAEEKIPEPEKKETPEEITAEQLSFMNEPQEEEERTDYLKEEVALTKEAEVQVNTKYREYESELITRNALIDTDLDELALLLPYKSFDARRKTLIDIIIENASYMEENSSRMSFEIITNIYGIIKLAFRTHNEKQFEINLDVISVFKNSILLIESLIKGDTFENYDKVIKQTEKIKTEITEGKQEKDNFEKIEKDKQELEKHLNLKYSDITQREKLILLKQYILELEKIFNSLDGIKSEFRIYEALRKLSSTFVRFKEMVNISRILNIRKLAQLSEASYIFVKFLQNYRLDPYDEDVREIFKFIIFNFKLIFLDKPTKDIDAFISILNDPVQVFSKTKKKKNE